MHYSRMKRYDVRRAMRNGVTVRMGSVEDVPVFNRMMEATAEKKGFRFSIPDIKVRMGSFMMTFTPLQKNPAKHSTGMFLMPMSRKWNKCRLNSRLSPRNSTKMKNLLSSSQCNLFSKFIKSAGLFTDYQYSIDRGDVHENRKNARSPPRRTDNTEPYGVRCR